ncbi:MAG: DUF72 domain-containing protein [bacterium]
MDHPVVTVGTSGFSFADWVGPVYPARTPKTRMLEYYERALGFDAVELNYTYYSMPAARTMDQLIAKTGAGFTFAVRSHQDMTHNIWADDKRRELRDVGPAFARFCEGVRPLAESGRLGCVLVQLPSFFWPGPANADYLRRLPDRLPGLELVVEFRNKAWLRDETWQLLAERGLGYCVVDEPQLPRLLPFDPRRTSGTGYFRFHGRNQAWFTASREERYNYLYSADELRGFVEPVKAVSAGAQRTFLFFNNCHAGAAARNALLMKQMLGLIEALTPEQARVVEGTAPPAGPEQLSLG